MYNLYNLWGVDFSRFYYQSHALILVSNNALIGNSADVPKHNSLNSPSSQELLQSNDRLAGSHGLSKAFLPVLELVLGKIKSVPAALVKYV